MAAEARTSTRLKPGPLDPTIGRTVREMMRRTGTPGVAVGIVYGRRVQAAGFGITSVAAPAPVDEQTLFQVGSTTKTFTAAAVMRLVERGEVDLDVPVRRYVRGLQLRDPQVTRKVTMRHLLTHTGGWVGDYFSQKGRGADALADIIADLRKVPQLTPLGSVWHYNNAGFYLAGRVLEKVCGAPYEQVVRDLLLDPLGMTRSFFFADEAISYRVAAGHTAKRTKHAVSTPWAMDRSVNPAGGLISDVLDQLRWARFNMGDGRAPDGRRVLKRATLRQMQRPQSPPADIADAVGLSWLIEDIDGVRTVAHGGTTPGHLSAFLMVPERAFAVTVLTNSSRGGEVHRAVVRRALKHYLGVERETPTPAPARGRDLSAYGGRYVNGLKQVALDISTRGTRLGAAFSLLQSDEDPGLPPFKLAPVGTDDVVIEGGRLNGYRAQFLRDERGRIRWLRLGGRLYRKTARR